MKGLNLQGSKLKPTFRQHPSMQNARDSGWFDLLVRFRPCFGLRFSALLRSPELEPYSFSLASKAIALRLEAIA